MTTQADSISDILEKIRKPLEFARKGDFAALHTLHGLDKTMHGLVEQGLGVEKDFGRKELLREIRVVFLEFDQQSESEKRRKIGAALELVDQLDRMLGRAVAPRAPETEEPGQEGAGILPAVVRDLPAWATRDEGDGDGDDDDEDDDEDEEPIPIAGADPIEGSGAGILPAVVRPAGEGESELGPDGLPRKRRRRRGGRRRRKGGEGAEGGATASGAGAGSGSPSGTTGAGASTGSRSGGRPPREGSRAGLAPAERPRPRLVEGGRISPEQAGIRIIGGEPPLPGRAVRPPEPRPVVRPGEAFSLEEGSSPETILEVVAPLPKPVGPPPPRMDDVKLALGKLSGPITEAKFVGPKLGEVFVEMGVKTVEDGLFDLPRAYQDRSKLAKISSLLPGKTETVMGTVKSRGMTRIGMRPGFELIVTDGTGEVRAKWFHVFRGMEARFEIGAKVIFAGKFEKYKDRLEVLHPEIEVLEEEEGPEAFARIVPVYALSEGLGQKTRRKIAANLIDDFAKDLPPATPYWARQKRGLVAPAEALARVTAPTAEDDVQLLSEHASPWHRSLAYDELFALQVGLALRKRAGSRERAPQLKIVHGLIAKLAALLPYPLTDAQERVLSEIKRDLMRQVPMHRLLQGDVGSGKTIVALMAALIAIENRSQVALMAPTEILAEQHFFSVKNLVERLGVRVALCTGSMKKVDREELSKKVAHGDVDLVVGTHALLSEGMTFRNLTLAIVDEQHRFGVTQRAALKQKGSAPHVLIMTATPIPRTLALTEFGDLDVSVIDKMPPGRTPVETRVCGEEERSIVYAQIRSDVSSGRQAYIIFPAVAGNEDQTLADATSGQKKLQRDVFPEFRVGLLHGQMTHEEKEGVMTRFKNGAVDILAATTVVEVGIDVPNATVMLVEHGERFGLAQLHQLRGRVGRGAAKSRAFFMIAPDASDDARERIGILERTGDGFEVAQADLELRGPGDVTGSRQAGMPAFRLADPLRDLDLMIQAREDAFHMVAADPKLREPEHKVVHEVVKHRWRGRLTLADVG